MKTYDEALDEVWERIPLDDPEAETKLIAARVRTEEWKARVRPTVLEIARNPRTAQYLAYFQDAPGTGLELAIDIFITGILIGMSMERAESWLEPKPARKKKTCKQ